MAATKGECVIFNNTIRAPRSSVIGRNGRRSRGMRFCKPLDDSTVTTTPQSRRSRNVSGLCSWDKTANSRPFSQWVFLAAA